jgi:ribosome silencing factor RsfS/YbeB/iojap
MEYWDNKIKEAEEKVLLKYKTKYPDKMERYYHILGVAKLAKSLATKYNVDPKKAYIAGLMHDYYKYESDEEMENAIKNKAEIEECKKCPVLYHAYASSHALKDILSINDPEMISAIKYHVFGHTNMTMLEKIILISDYCEETRKYKDCIEVRDILLSGHLDLAIYESTKRVIGFLNKKNIVPHPMQYEVLNEYERRIKMNKLEIVKEALSHINPTEVVSYDLNHTNPFFDYIIVCELESVRQANAAIDYLKDELAKEGMTFRGCEGRDTGWVLIDLDDMLIHVFTKEERKRVDIDSLYLDFKKESLM